MLPKWRYKGNKFLILGRGVERIQTMKKAIARLIHCPETSFFLFGPRGTGKSTWLNMVMPNALLIDLLSQEEYHHYLTKPDRLETLVKGNLDVQTVIIDEIQKIPELLSVVHRLIEKYPDKRFVLTGSSARKLKRAGVDLLAGRAIFNSCHPFIAAELGDAFCLEHALKVGLVPLVREASDPEAVLRSYIALYLREEVQTEGLVRNIGSFARFLEAISFSHGSMLNVSEVARECEVSRKTVEGYVEILNDLLISFHLPVFEKRAKRQLVKHAKFFFFDAGVYRSVRPKGPLDRASEIDGLALEGLVLQHLRAWNEYGDNSNKLFFWRTKSGSEIDFVVYGQNEFSAIEVKNTAKVASKDLRALNAFAADYPEAQCILLYRGARRELINNVWCLPCEDFLKELRPGQRLCRV
jgi:predicted AAA+ superfamily ATPase